MDFIELDNKLGAAFGFASSGARNKGHLGYSDSWDLGHGYGILATGGKSQGNTCLVSLNGSGCAPVKNWQAVYDLETEVSYHEPACPPCGRRTLRFDQVLQKPSPKPQGAKR